MLELEAHDTTLKKLNFLRKEDVRQEFQMIS
jgi:hypothetical protein